MSEIDFLADQIETTGRTLRRAAHDGTLHAHRRGRRRLELSPGEQLYVRRRWPLLSALRRALRTEPNVRLAVLFGSAARGDDRPDSDVDVLIDLREAGALRTASLAERLSEAAVRRVELVLLHDAERNPVLLAGALREGRVLVDREGLWARLSARKAELETAAQRRLAEGRDRALAAIATLP
jgi:predicted nucleotidyltransferase